MRIGGVTGSSGVSAEHGRTSGRGCPLWRGRKFATGSNARCWRRVATPLAGEGRVRAVLWPSNSYRPNGLGGREHDMGPRRTHRFGRVLWSGALVGSLLVTALAVPSGSAAAVTPRSLSTPVVTGLGLDAPSGIAASSEEQSANGQPLAASAVACRYGQVKRRLMQAYWQIGGAR